MWKRSLGIRLILSIIVNKQLGGSECLRCKQPETWDCAKISALQRKLAQELLVELLKHRLEDAKINDVLT